MTLDDLIHEIHYFLHHIASSHDESGGPGLDKNADPYAEWTRLEFWDENNKHYLKEYEGRGLLQGKTVLTTGGDSGIGRSAAILFSREGADASIVYLPEEEEDAQYMKKKVEEAGRKVHLMQFDLKDKANCEKAVEGHRKAFETAMQEMSLNITENDLAVTEKTFQTNVISMFAMSKYALKHMKRGDTVINYTSVAAYMSNPTFLDYASTKGAIATFTRGLAQQQAKIGIRVNAVAPGII
ncbi:NAD(P)-binding protein [Lentithecium fluviatile CBS 122367]|uniref:NAD(P)-binding protein n=1 Tax=Lentithecium fluviatile CBS 122367 TaxID=1168545 RepID=A0A6G1IWH6_9PLEO|nr:NAD(P)-binding protein [Lentithecium fluviatile CBS 122367]